MTVGLHPAYVRGEAYLAAHEGGKAAGEFQKIIDHRVLALNPVGALAHLTLPVPMLYKETQSKPKRHIKISSRSGKMPTPIYKS